MNRRFRLTGSADFQRVRRSGKAFRHPLLVMVYLPNSLQASRIGVVAGRTVGKAVQRNRAKRLIRSAVQPIIPAIPAGWDILLIAREPIVVAPFHKVQQALMQLLRQAKLLIDMNDNDQS